MPAGQDAADRVHGLRREESGLNGSPHFVDNMPLPVSQAQAMINLAMIGRLRDEQKLQIGGVETAAGFMDILRPLFDASGLPITPQGGGSGPSDHASFNAKGIPVLFFHTGLHGEYHAPSDEAWTINHEGAVATANLAAEVALTLADACETPSSARRPPVAWAMPRARISPGHLPGNYSDTMPGVVVGDVTRHEPRTRESRRATASSSGAARNSPTSTQSDDDAREARARRGRPDGRGARGQGDHHPVTMKAPAPRGQ